MGGNRAGRGFAASGVMADWLEARRLQGRVLSVNDDTGQVFAALASAEAEPVSWDRYALEGRDARPWPPEGPFAGATVRLPKGREHLDMVLHAVGARLGPDAPLWVYGANDEGVRSVPGRAKELFATVETVDVRRHCRIVEARSPIVALRGELSAWRTHQKVELPDGPLMWATYPGTFAKGRLDRGTAMLIEQLPRLAPGDRVLDFASGVGVVAMVLHRRCPGVQLDLLDVDALAIEAARENVPDATTIVSDGFTRTVRSDYAWIVSNPPLHRGHRSDRSVLEELVREAPRRLRPGGVLLLVTERTQPVGRMLREVFREGHLVCEGGGYRVWRGSC